jgi:hypothetical protein
MLMREKGMREKGTHLFLDIEGDPDAKEGEVTKRTGSTNERGQSKFTLKLERTGSE